MTFNNISTLFIYLFIFAASLLLPEVVFSFSCFPSSQQMGHMTIAMRYLIWYLRSWCFGLKESLLYFQTQLQLQLHYRLYIVHMHAHALRNGTFHLYVLVNVSGRLSLPSKIDIDQSLKAKSNNLWCSWHFKSDETFCSDGAADLQHIVLGLMWGSLIRLSISSVAGWSMAVPGIK